MSGARRTSRARGTAACACLVLACAAPVLALSATARAEGPPPYRIARPAERTLANGLRVMVFRDSRLPIVQIQLAVPAGSTRDPAGREGVAALTAQLLLQGTSSRAADAFADAVNRLGANVNGTAVRDFSLLSGGFLARDFEAGMELLSDAALHAIFPEDAFQNARAQAGRSLIQLRQNAARTADEQIWALALGDRPLGRSTLGTLNSLLALTAADVREFHARDYRPQGAILAIAGDIAPERAFEVASRLFAGWAGPAGATTPARASAPLPGPVIRVVDVATADRSELRVGFPLPGRAGADEPALAAASAVLGGVPGSRLERMGAPRGFAGPARSTYTVERDGGLLVAGGSVETDSVANAIARLRTEVAALAETPEPSFLTHVARVLAELTPNPFETLGGRMSQWCAARFQGITDDELIGYAGRLGAVNAAEVARAAKRWLDPAKAAILVVGPADRLKPVLERLGKVEILGPEKPPQAAAALPAPTAETRARARELVGQAVAAHGGAARLEGIQDSSVDADMMLMVNGAELPATSSLLRKEPDKMLHVTRVMTFETRQVLNGENAWSFTSSSDRVKRGDSLEVAALRSGFRSDVPHLLLSAADPRSEVVHRGRDKVGDREADLVDVTPPGDERFRLAFDARSHLLLALYQHPESPTSGSFLASRLYRDYRDVGGIQWPFFEERALEGQNSMTIKLRQVKLNSGLPNSVFGVPLTAE